MIKYKNLKIIGVNSLKGGCGVTTVVANLGYALSEYGKVLLIDGCPLPNLTEHFYSESDYLKTRSSFFDYLRDKISINDYIKKIDRYKTKEIFLLGNKNNLDFGNIFSNEITYNPEKIKELIEYAKKENFDFIICDISSFSCKFTYNLKSICNYILPVINLEPYAYYSILRLLDEIDIINKKIMLNAIVANKVNINLGTHKKYLQELTQAAINPIFQLPFSGFIPTSQFYHRILREVSPNNSINNVFDEMALFYKNLEFENGEKND
jgi:cellulose biosynthesis protein BcsQ